MNDKSDEEKVRQGSSGNSGLGWGAGKATGGSSAGDGVDEELERDEYGDEGRSATSAMADMDTSGLVESQTTRPSTITPSERPERDHNTERANPQNQRDALSNKLNDEDDNESLRRR